MNKHEMLKHGQRDGGGHWLVLHDDNSLGALRWGGGALRNQPKDELKGNGGSEDLGCKEGRTDVSILCKQRETPNVTPPSPAVYLTLLLSPPEHSDLISVKKTQKLLRKF